MELLSNQLLWTGVAASLAAQIIKVLLILLLERRWRPAAFMETGGMPSSHSCMVVALTTGLGIQYGFGGPLFAVSAVFSLIVMYDATGVRRSSGMQAALLNLLLEELREVVREGFAPAPLRVFLGHTYVEVFVGALLGVLVAVVSFHLF
ncbi:hypothetical protein HNR42_001986 [Deinobacterium chartae]|uniref:Divergent PAP2 family protein n=1 Tax=Deinobacterium chartae TaxID=521158 RepID=A0A841I3F0_9DEIO|nr:divergent PAP2 family protein [Deinobacterium chartae]MBB6098552.1 hypothetical protein [Deinobacterium chartae]